MHTTVMYRNEGDCGMHNNVQDKWGLSNIHTTYTTQEQRESSYLVRVNLNIHEPPGYAQYTFRM